MSIAVALGRQRARLLEAIGLRRLAAHAWGEVLLIDPGNVEAARRLGHIAQARGKDEEALGWFGRATESAPQDAEVWFELGSLRADMDDRQGALAAFAHAVSLDETHARAWHAMGRCHVELAAYAEAAECLQRASGLQPDDADLLYELGVAQCRAGQHEASVVTRARLAAIDPQRAGDLDQELQQALPAVAQAGDGEG